MPPHHPAYVPIATDLDAASLAEHIDRPMRILTRYVLIEFLKVFFIVLGSMTLMMILLGVVKEARDLGFGPTQVVRLVPYILPDALRFTVPGTALFSVCNLYGRMSGSNEIVAIKSLGIHPKTILVPVAVFVFLLSLGTVWLNDLAVSWGRQGIRQVALEAVEEIALSALRSQGSYATDKFAINVQEVVGRQLIQPIIMFEADGDRENVTIRAEQAEFRTDPAGDVLSIILRNGHVRFGSGESFEFPHHQESWDIDLRDFSRAGRENRGPSNLSLSEIRDATPTKRSEITDFKRELAVKSGFQMLTGDFYQLTHEEWQTEARVLRGIEEHLYRLRTEPSRRWANGFSCLCFMVVGAPVAIRRRNSDLLTSFFVVFVPILVVYYPLLIFGIGAAKDGLLPPQIVWLGNIILLLWGSIELRRIMRH